MATKRSTSKKGGRKSAKKGPPAFLKNKGKSSSKSSGSSVSQAALAAKFRKKGMSPKAAAAFARNAKKKGKG